VPGCPGGRATDAVPAPGWADGHGGRAAALGLRLPQRVAAGGLAGGFALSPCGAAQPCPLLPRSPWGEAAEQPHTGEGQGVWGVRSPRGPGFGKVGFSCCHKSLVSRGQVLAPLARLGWEGAAGRWGRSGDPSAVMGSPAGLLPPALVAVGLGREQAPMSPWGRDPPINPTLGFGNMRVLLAPSLGPAPQIPPAPQLLPHGWACPRPYPCPTAPPNPQLGLSRASSCPTAPAAPQLVLPPDPPVPELLPNHIWACPELPLAPQILLPHSWACPRASFCPTDPPVPESPLAP